MSRSTLPPGQQLAAPGRWPQVGERAPRDDASPWRVSIAGEVERPLTLSLAELAALPQVEQAIDIHCVTRWSKLGVSFSGVLLAELLTTAQPRATARFVSFVARSSRAHSTSLDLSDAIALGAFVALQTDGQPLSSEYGGPVRVVVPGRYFYKSLKWLERIDVLADDRLGFWEAQAGYHNVADPRNEQRFIAASISRHDMQKLLASRDWSRREVLGVEARGLDLSGLVARDAILRNAHFEQCQLREAVFDGANLSNAHFAGADLRLASFCHADAEGSDFVGADLRGADFRGASLLGATFAGPDALDAAFRPPGASIDRTTRFDNAALAELAPPQAAFVFAALRG
ncbi:MAG: molybdopterin-dependent oxidoreductase [Pirellulales bacterium]|nr:molybdopterin-dependent oxidoreductase [Pirellulales bacterium]